MNKEMGYIVAQGPEELEKILNQLLEKNKLDLNRQQKEEFILYELGYQKSMIKMDMAEWPVVFWHYDLLGRPATSVVKDIIARFAWEKCGEKEWYFNEKGMTELDYRGKGLNIEDAFLDWRQQIFDITK